MLKWSTGWKDSWIGACFNEWYLLSIVLFLLHFVFTKHEISNVWIPLPLQKFLFNILKRIALKLLHFFSIFCFAKNLKIIFEIVLTVSEMQISAINGCPKVLVLWVFFLVKVYWVEIQNRLQMSAINLARLFVIVIIFVFHS